MVKKDEWKGFLFVVGAAFLWGLSSNVAKYLFNRQVNVWDLVQMRVTLSFLFLVTVLGIGRRALLSVKREHYLYFFIFGAVGLTSVQTTYLLTISLTNVATAVFLQYLAPVFVFTYGLLRRQEKLAPGSVLAIVLSTLGGFLMVKGSPGGGLAVSPYGLTAGLAAALAFAFYTLYGKKGLENYSPWTLLVYGFAAGGLAYALFYRLPWKTFLGYGWQEWLFFVYIAVFSTILPFGFYFKGLNYLAPVKANLTATLEPVVGGTLAYFLLGEMLTPWQVLGCLLIVAGVTVIQLQGSKG